MARPSRPRIRREDVFAGIIVAAFVVSVLILVALVLVAQWFEPDGFLGRPGRIQACGREYQLGAGRVWTRDDIDAAVAQGAGAEVFEPVLGQLPLLAPLTGKIRFNGFEVCDTLVWLHVGPNAYLAYALEGGP